MNFLVSTLLTLLLAGIVIAPVSANDTDCVSSDDVVGARYAIINKDGDAIREITLLRQAPGRVVYLLGSDGITQIYERYSDELVAVIEYFDGEQIGVEHEPSTDAAPNGWDALYEFFPKRRVAALTESKTDAFHCLSASRYDREDADGGLSVTLLTDVALPLTVKQTSGQGEVHWQLSELITGRGLLEATLERVDTYTTYDFADLGDSEHEEFFRNSEYLQYKLHGESGVHSH